MMKNTIVKAAIESAYLLFFLSARPVFASSYALSDAASDGDLSESSAAESSGGAKALQPYNRPLNKAKGVETMLNQGVEDRMRNVDGLDGEK